MLSGAIELPAEQVLGGPASLRRKRILKEFHFSHAVELEEPKVVPEFAPRAGEPEGTIKAQHKRVDRAAGFGGLFVAVAEAHLASGADGGSQPCQIECQRRLLSVRG